MKKVAILSCFLVQCMCLMHGQEMKWKHFRLKLDNLNGWNYREFPGTKNWDDTKNEWCSCAALYFFKTKNNIPYHILVYPVAASPDSAKYFHAGKLTFEPQEKYEQIRNKNFSFTKTRSYFRSKENGNIFPVIRYITKKVDNIIFIFYAWVESAQLNPDMEKELFSLINSFEII